MSEVELDINTLFKAHEHATPYQKIGKILSSQGMVYEVSLPKAV